MYETSERLRWRGRETVTIILKTLGQGGHLEVDLPPEYHYALHRRLSAGNHGWTSAEQVDAEGDSTLLAAIAGVGGLEELAELVKPLTAAGARVHIVSPGPTIYVVIPPRPTDDYTGD